MVTERGKNRRRMALFLALALLLCLLGCGRAAEQEAAPYTPPKTIRMAIYADMQAYRQLARQYMDLHPELEIEIIEYPEKIFRAVNRKLLAEGDGFDVFPIGIGEYKTYADSDYCVDMTDIFVDKLAARYAQPDDIFSVRSYNGRIVSLPAQVQGTVVYYNRRMFRDMGVKVPRNWDEFIYLCVRLNSNNKVPMAMGIKDDWPLIYLMCDFLATNVQAKDLGWGTDRSKALTKFSKTPGCMESYVSYREMIVNQCFAPDAVYMSDEQAQYAFLAGEAAMYYGRTGSFSLVNGKNERNIDIGAFPLPVNATGEAAAVPLETGGDLAVWKESQYPEEAVDFLLYTLEPQNNLLVNTDKYQSPFQDVEVPLHGTMQEYHEWKENVLTVPYAVTQQNWPDSAPFPDPMIKYMKDCFVGRREMSAKEFWIAQDNAWDDAYANRRWYS